MSRERNLAVFILCKVELAARRSPLYPPQDQGKPFSDIAGAMAYMAASLCLLTIWVRVGRRVSEG